MTNTQVAESFLNSAAMGDVQEAYDRYVSPDFIHHNQYFKGDRQSLLDAMKEASKTSPNKSFKIKKVIQEGSSVATYSEVIQNDMSIVVVHIFKIENGKIVELWDVGQVISPDSPNENGLF